MEVVVTTGAISRAKLQSNHHHQQTNTQFFTGRMPFLSPNQQCQSTEGKISRSMDLLTPSSPGVFKLCVWPLIAPGYLGKVSHASHQPSDVSTHNKLFIYISQNSCWETKKKQLGKHLLVPSKLRQEHWSSLLKFAKTPRDSSNLKVNSGCAMGPPEASALGGNTSSLYGKPR